MEQAAGRQHGNCLNLLSVHRKRGPGWIIHIDHTRQVGQELQESGCARNPFSHKNDKKENAGPFLPALELRLLSWTGRRWWYPRADGPAGSAPQPEGSGGGDAPAASPLLKHCVPRACSASPAVSARWPHRQHRPCHSLQSFSRSQWAAAQTRPSHCLFLLPAHRSVSAPARLWLSLLATWHQKQPVTVLGSFWVKHCYFRCVPFLVLFPFSLFTYAEEKNKALTTPLLLLYRKYGNLSVPVSFLKSRNISRVQLSPTAVFEGLLLCRLK